MGEHTQKLDFVWPVWQSGSTRVFRPIATALGAGCSGHLFLGRCGVVDDVAAPGRSGDSGRGSAASGARGLGSLATAGEASARAGRIEQYGGVEPRTETVTAAGGGGNLRSDLCPPDETGRGDDLVGRAVLDRRLLDAVSAYGIADRGLSIGQHSAWGGTLAGHPGASGAPSEHGAGRPPLLGPDAWNRSGE